VFTLSIFCAIVADATSWGLEMYLLAYGLGMAGFTRDHPVGAACFLALLMILRFAERSIPYVPAIIRALKAR